MLYGNIFSLSQSCLGIINRITLLFFLVTTSSCANTQLVTLPKTEFYVIPEITYLRESPGYEEKVLTQLYRGDRVIIMEDSDSTWGRVQQVPDGQIGWVQKVLLTSVAIPSSFYYVNQDGLPLLSCPRNDCLTIQSLSRGDRVSRLEENSQGWCHVQLMESGIRGWLPASALTEQLADDIRPKQVSKDYYYVAVKKLGLRAKPWIKDEIIRTLKFNEQVQKISQNSLGWFKVRLPADGALGWVISRYLEPLPLVAPRPEVQTKAKPRSLKERKEPITEPEIM
jgi:uncharacterized protein YgiM (DUF1202 family)